jgi:hypothetical protein
MPSRAPVYLPSVPAFEIVVHTIVIVTTNHNMVLVFRDGIRDCRDRDRDCDRHAWWHATSSFIIVNAISRRQVRLK